MAEVTVDDLRGLLESDVPDPVLVLTGGRLVVEPSGDRTAGASEVITRGDLRKQSEDRALDLIAATLTTTIVQRGG
ncbi:hypothetical protein Q5425_36790 [Amycolatopsis sp. A133]|uniref:hypothetical protein n=1 Tax=Amycolatopsis sp. A133 TaxID=3064472 RepID=UPI0027EAF846|nr:hypothetical protein [Amycolatopsis sp. A133]MDQ7809315.1 hypothetical protein [Amycolatopsis sp. A133]